MPVFRDADHFYRVVGGFVKVAEEPRTFDDLRRWWGDRSGYYENGDEVNQINEMGRKMGRAGMVAEFEIVRPDALICIDAKHPQNERNYTVYLDESPVAPDLRVKTSGDVAHRFWGGQVSVPVAIMTGKIKTKGPKHRALKLLPRIIPAFSLYPRYLELIGEDQLLQVLLSFER